MKLIDTIANRLGFVRKTARRNYAGAAMSRLTNDWTTAVTNADTEMRGDAKRLRARARELERNNDYARRYLKALEQNVLGADGIGLQMKVKDFNGDYDRQANNQIEAAWHAWGKATNCSLNGLHSWYETQRLILRSVARDGAVLVRKHKGQARGPFGFQLELIEIDQLDWDFEKVDGNTLIRFGVEYDKSTMRPLAYWILSRHPGDINGVTLGYKRERIPAAEIIHVFLPERIGQTSGVTWLCSAMSGLHQLGAYQEAELIQSRIACMKGGFYTHKTPDGQELPSDTQGNLIQSLEPGQFEDLPMGTEFVPYDPQHPTQAYPFFVKATLRGISSGLGVSYNTLANDLEGVNYSSIRAGLLDEREEWKAIQTWFIERVCQAIFPEWLEMSLLSGAVNLPFSKFDKFNAHEWKARRWQWVDPEKDVNASIAAVANGFKSKRQIIAESGGDIEDTFQDIAEDARLASTKGINIDSDNLRTAADAYGVAARAGVVTPCADDENFFRVKMQLPPMPPEVKTAWKDEATRRPITLAVEDEPPPVQSSGKTVIQPES
jgi:lambda family phage portal protein